MEENTTRTPSALDQLCDSYVDNLATLDPLFGSYCGLEGFDAQWPDFSPAGFGRINDLNTRFRADVRAAQKIDDVDRITAAAVDDRMGVATALFDAGEDAMLNNIACPVQSVRDTFSTMKQDTPEALENIAARLAGIPEVFAGYEESLREAAGAGRFAARRQIAAVLSQIDDVVAENSYFDNFVADLVREVPGVSSELAEKLHDGVVAAKRGFADLGSFIRDNLAEKAPEKDAVGRERYELLSHSFVGARVDLDDAYEWAVGELADIDAQQRVIAEKLYGAGVSPQEAMTRLNDDPAYQLHGVDALQKWMQKTADQAVADLNGVHFDIPEPVRTIECMIDKTGTGGIYYTGPTDDFSRPGRMWWSVPEGETLFHTWQELTTVFHEGVPGHHLQIGITTYARDTLNKWRRLALWNSGHGEGWALYAEQLMADLGYHDDPANYFGMLDAQRLRAARVMLDIGVHLEKEIPEGGKVWDAEYAWAFLKHNVAMADGFLKFELDRYLGWAGQAPSYKLGQRLWLQLRDEYLATAAGRSEEATVKAFHAKALPLGALPMGTLREAVLGL